jgi:hypothetical protein
MLQHISAPDELRESLEEVTNQLEQATWSVADLCGLLDSRPVHALAVRRIGRRNIERGQGWGLEPLETLEWLQEESAEQVELLTDALGFLLEPVRTSKTRYGKRSGIFPRAPYSGSCGSWATYQAHRRRGQDCEVCKKAAREYNASRRAARERTMWRSVAPWPDRSETDHGTNPKSRDELNRNDTILRLPERRRA